LLFYWTQRSDLLKAFLDPNNNELFLNTMKRDPHMNPSSRFDAMNNNVSCIALIDARYIAWLLGQINEPASEGINRHALNHVLSSLLIQNCLMTEVSRVYWYSDKNDHQYPQDQIHRSVVPHSVDGGISLFNTLSHDLKRLTDRRACDHLFIASDDERLLNLVDEAQLSGMAVHLLTDESVRQMDQLSKEDPGWVRLLSQADRLIVLHSQAAKELISGKGSAHTSSAQGANIHTTVPAVDLDIIRPKFEEVVKTWWAEEPEDLREDLREELQASRGIPQEIDRHLLLQVRKTLERTLSFPEKKVLRELIRNTVLETEEK
jgi:hypothetical protein